MSGNLTLPDIHPTSQKNLADRFRELTQREAELAGLKGPELLLTLFPESAEDAKPIRDLADRVQPEWDVRQVFDLVSSFISQPELPGVVEHVRVMSLHKSKGLTARCVVVAGCVQGALPRLDPGLSEAEQLRALEEQRRLMYVALTRTTETLLLSSILTIPKSVALSMNIAVSSGKGPDATTQTSQFWSELGPAAPDPIPGLELP